MKVIRYLLSFLLLFACLPPKREVVKPPAFSFDLIYCHSTSFEILPKLFSLKESLSQEQPTLFFLTSDIFLNDLLNCGEKSSFFSLVRIINRIGVDAVLITPALFPFFNKFKKEVFDSSQFFLLASNLFQKQERVGAKKPVFHQFLNKKLAGHDLIFLNVLSDSNLLPNDFFLEAPSSFLKKRITLHGKTSLIGCFVDTLPNSFSSLPALFLRLPRGESLICYRVTYEMENYSLKPLTIPPLAGKPTLKESVSLLEKRIENFLNQEMVETKQALSPERFSSLFFNFLLKREKADFFFAVKNPIKGGLKKGKVKSQEIWANLEERGFLILGLLPKEKIDEMMEKREIYIYPLKKPTKKICRVLATKDVYRKERLPLFQISYPPNSLFESTVNFLRAGYGY